MEAMGLDWFPKILIYTFDEIADNIGHTGQIEENIGRAEKYSRV